MKKIGMLVLGMMPVFFVPAFAADDDIAKNASCKYCGMDRQKHAHSRMLVEYEDGTAAAFCSLHCAAVDLSINIDKAPKAIMVGDYGTKALTDAEKAIWVVGGGQKGVMTKNPKWAFENKADAEAFVKANSGTIADFESAVKAAYADMYEDTKMIREKRKMMKQQPMPGMPGMMHR